MKALLICLSAQYLRKAVSEQVQRNQHKDHLFVIPTFLGRLRLIMKEHRKLSWGAVIALKVC